MTGQRAVIKRLYRLWYGFDPIPQSEIDAEVRRILAEYPDDPVAYAAGVVERLQWSKDARAVVKAERVSNKIKGSIQF